MAEIRTKTEFDRLYADALELINSLREERDRLKAQIEERKDNQEYFHRAANRLQTERDALERERDALRLGIERALKLLPGVGSDEASTLDMEIEARGYLTDALRASEEKA